MVRCKRTDNLEVYHKRLNGDISQNNAIVLCKQCYEASEIFERGKIETMDFPLLTKIFAKLNADFICECTNNSGCH